MGQGAKIEWTQATWNPVVGCAKVSAGCKNCYAERMSKRLGAMARSAQTSGTNPGRIANYLHVIDKHGAWNGKLFLDDSAINTPLKWKSPRLIFVNSMSDLFHNDVPLQFIQRVFEVMNRCSHHTFQILTKRPERAADFSKHLKWTPNIWMGTSVENVLVTHRIKDIRRTHATTKFLSIEPLLGPMPRLSLAGIDWVIVGGESGPGARPMEKEWVIQIKNRCIAQDVRFFFKQWGGLIRNAQGVCWRIVFGTICLLAFQGIIRRVFDLPPPKYDGLKTTEVGRWSSKKHHYLHRYIVAFTNAMTSKNWGSLHYIDLFAGAGIEQIKGGGLEWGSPLIAAQAPKKFTQLHLCEKEKGKFDTLQK